MCKEVESNTETPKTNSNESKKPPVPPTDSNHSLKIELPPPARPVTPEKLFAPPRKVHSGNKFGETPKLDENNEIIEEDVENIVVENIQEAKSYYSYDEEDSNSSSFDQSRFRK